MNFIPSAAKPDSKPVSPAELKKKKQEEAEQSSKAIRETIESIVIAVILAFLFRAFEAEAFVIPTGSMAPTLQGRHKDVECPQCHFRYRTGASQEEPSGGEPGHTEVVGTVCPICSYALALDPKDDPNQASFTGDRILVSKFAYQLQDPQRWDAIVFKYPGNAKQNYIKRLIGLPNEAVKIFHGDIFITKPGEKEEHIARKPPYKLADTLQLVDDTQYLAESLVQLKWPSRWQTWRAPNITKPAEWKMTPDGKSFNTTGEGEEAWLRYQHITPLISDWNAMSQGKLPTELQGLSDAEFTQKRHRLIGDFSTYNESFVMSKSRFTDIYAQYDGEAFREEIRKNWSPYLSTGVEKPDTLRGEHWVGDLGLEADVAVASQQGELLLTLIEGGVHYSCRIDVATGVAKLEIDRGATEFVSSDGQQKAQFPTATTRLRGPGTYQVRLTNCNDEVLLWINGELAQFDGPTTYANRPDCAPQWSPADPGDMAPAGIGSKGAAFSVSNLRIYRDVYYIAAGNGMQDGRHRNLLDDYGIDEQGKARYQYIAEVFRNPQLWSTTELFKSRGHFGIQLEDDQFFPLGDNSPASQDARSWFAEPYVTRDLLIGKALLIYWPHAWNRPVPFTPNVQRMGIIH